MQVFNVNLFTVSLTVTTALYTKNTNAYINLQVRSQLGVMNNGVASDLEWRPSGGGGGGAFH